MNELHPELVEWRTQERPRNFARLSKVPRGFRDLMWCPLLNEPIILEYRQDRPYCSGCGNGKDSSFEAETHAFLGSVRKPLW